MSKLISIIIPCFNAEKWLKEAIESCFQQSYSPIEVIVIDDGSRDGSLEIIKSYDRRLIWETGPNRGGNYARNRGIELSNGAYIQYLDADDYLLLDKIERQVNFLEKTDADIVYGDVNYQYHLPDGKIVQEPVNIGRFSGNHQDMLQSLLVYGCLPPIAYLFKKSAVVNSIKWDETLKCGQDRDFLISLAIKGAKIIYQPGCYSIYRKYGNVTVSTSNKVLLVESFCLILAKSEVQLVQADKLEPKYQKALAQSYYLMTKEYRQDISFLCYCRLIFSYIWLLFKFWRTETKLTITKLKIHINTLSNEVKKIMRKRAFKLILLFFLFLGLATCSSNAPQNLMVNSAPQENTSFRIWWSQGFLPEENEVVARLIKQWEKESGKKAELRLIPLSSIDAETQKSLNDGNPPDVLYSATAETNLIPSLAWKNQLADVSDLINPIKNLYSPTALEAVYFQNNISKKRSYYSAPIGQQATHLFYWRNILQETGLNEQEIPTNWDDFWKFWQEAQDRLRKNGKSDIYSLGLTMSALGTDTFLIFQEFLEAYNVKIVDQNGNLLLKNPGNREGIIKALKDYTDFYKAGYVPPGAVEWKDSGNNVSFLESQSLMTANGTLSIPLSQKLDQNQYNKLSTDLYLNKMVTRGWPEKPGGGEITSILGVKQIVVFEASQHKEEAKSFLAYLLKPENLNQFLKEGGKGRIIPVMPKLLQDSYWNNPTDPHIPVAIKQLNGLTRPGYEVFNPAYSEVLAQNIWSKAILSIIKDGVSPEQAADKTIEKIEEIFAQWK